MRLGIITPVLTRIPRTHAQWEREAGIVEVARIAAALEELGYHHLTCSEHVGIPVPVAEVRGSTYWDPLSVFGYLAATTTSIRFLSYVVVLGYHHPMDVVKRYGTLDRISGGRLILGVGVGSLQEEFELLGAPFDGRGPRADEAIRALKASFGRATPEYHGAYYEYGGFVVDPTSVQTDMPIWMGGRTARSLRRAVELGDGWIPFGLTLDQIEAMLARARETEAWEARTTSLEIGIDAGKLDPGGDPDRTREKLGRMEAIGATALETRLVHHSLDHYIEQLAALRELAGA